MFIFMRKLFDQEGKMSLLTQKEENHVNYNTYIRLTHVYALLIKHKNKFLQLKSYRAKSAYLPPSYLYEATL